MELFLLSKTIIKNTKWQIKYIYKQLVNINTIQIGNREE